MHSLIMPMLLIQLAVAAATSLAATITLDGCESKCGEVDVPYPFGTSHGCHRRGFKVTCDHAYSPPKLFLEGDAGGLEVLEISIPNRTVRVTRVHVKFLSFAPGNTSDVAVEVVPANLEQYVLSTDRNSLIIVGCGFRVSARMTMPSLQGDTVFASCAPSCTVNNQQQPNLYEGGGCCEAAIPAGLTSFNIQFSWLDHNAMGQPPEMTRNASVLLVEQEWWRNTQNMYAFKIFRLFSTGHAALLVIPIVLDWTVGQSSCPVAEMNPEFGCVSKNSECLNSITGANGYACRCKDGYNGNPYVTDGCQGSGKHVAAGVFLAIGISIGLFLLLLALAAIFATKRLKIHKAKKMREYHFKQNRGLLLRQLVDKDIAEKMIFSLEELEKATNKFDEARVLGDGGHGTVYKGILSNQRVVAIKKSRIVVQKEIDEFINEVAILSQINHRNIVKLDIKTANVLLDDQLIAKISDFGTSRGISIDQSVVTTGVSLVAHFVMLLNQEKLGVEEHLTELDGYNYRKKIRARYRYSNGLNFWICVYDTVLFSRPHHLLVSFEKAYAAMELAVAAAADIALDGCESKCGDVDIPYPFGTSQACHRRGFKVTCDRASNPPKLFLEKDGPEVLEISVSNRTVRVRTTVWSLAAGNAADADVRVLATDLEQYVLSAARNSLVLVGCGFHALVRTSTTSSSSQAGGAAFGSCAPSCPSDKQQQLQHDRCDGTGCCQASIPTRLSSFHVQFSWLEQNGTATPPWVAPNASVLAVEDWWRDAQNVLAVKMSLLSTGNVAGLVVPVVLDWTVNESSCAAAASRPYFACVSKNSECLNSSSSAYGYVCRCNDGNPYVPDGCQGPGVHVAAEQSTAHTMTMRSLALAVLLRMLLQLKSAAAAGIALPGCESKCSDVDVPYPFGTSDGCHRAGFKVTCDRGHQPPKLFLGGGGGPEVLAVSLRNSTVRVRGRAWSFAASTTRTARVDVLPSANNLRQYVLSAARNSLVVIGCGFQAQAAARRGEAAFASCAPSCPGSKKRKLQHGPCDGAACCEAPIPTGLTSLDVQFTWLPQNATARPAWVAPGASVLVVEQEWWRDRENVVPVKLSLLSSGNATGFVIPAVLDWTLNGSSCAAAAKMPDYGCVSKNSECLNSTSSAYGYVCRCNDGYNGNPYVPDGCRGSRMHLGAGNLVVPLLLVQLATAAAAANIALAGCENKCGDVDVPYPFGTTYGCHRTGFKVICDRAYQPPRLFLQSDGPEVLAISVQNSTVRVCATAWRFAAGNASDAAARTTKRQGGATFGSCAPSCSADEQQKLRHGGCHGVGCCELFIPTGLMSFHIQFSWLDQNATARPPWVAPGASVLTVEQEWWRDRDNVFAVKMSLLSSGNATGLVIPAVLDWTLNKSSCAAAAKRSDFGCVSKNSECLNSTSSAYTATLAGATTATTATHTCQMGARGLKRTLDLVSSIESPSEVHCTMMIS
ncbi:hypothetical protein BAE44_0012734 [Dichanthelium oligosanthes]|uniref:Protein kinase domain-containing protein n=1 Tax=Dichanthelium oligosanthes TaxID=888268 RepID=A0A1E5VM86_9POAL|nr:hypothetical protein BAE44_0012734 [Dichanthelium oligosanthes]